MLVGRAAKMCNILPDSCRVGSVEWQPKRNKKKKICVLICNGIATIIIIIAGRNQCLLGCSECIQQTQHAYTNSADNWVRTHREADKATEDKIDAEPLFHQWNRMNC